MATLYSDMPDSTQISINNATPTSAPHPRSGRVISQTADNEGRASARLESGRNPEVIRFTSPFLKLPPELRIKIYRHLLHAHGDICIRELYVEPREAPKGILKRTLPENECSRHSASCGKMVTYGVNAIGVHPAILSVNRQIYLEASRIFYSENCFNFCNDGVSAWLTANATIIPFFEDRPEGSRRLINRIRFSYILSHFLHHLRPHDRMFDEVCNYLSQQLQLERVTLILLCTTTLRILVSTAYKDHLSNPHQQLWIKHLVPLVKNLDTFTITEYTSHDDDLMRAAQMYLESKMDKASKLQKETEDADCTRASSMIPW